MTGEGEERGGDGKKNNKGLHDGKEGEIQDSQEKRRRRRRRKAGRRARAWKRGRRFLN